MPSANPAHQAAHRAHVFAAVERGELLLGGPLAEPTDGANVLLFQSDTAEVAEAFAKADPYVQHGIVNRWRVRPWQTVVGAVLPVRCLEVSPTSAKARPKSDMMPRIWALNPFLHRSIVRSKIFSLQLCATSDAR